jgi:amino acid permease
MELLEKYYGKGVRYVFLTFLIVYLFGCMCAYTTIVSEFAIDLFKLCGFVNEKN